MRVLLKISWEALAWWKWFGFDEKMLDKVTEIVKEIANFIKEIDWFIWN